MPFVIPLFDPFYFQSQTEESTFKLERYRLARADERAQSLRRRDVALPNARRTPTKKDPSFEVLALVNKVRYGISCTLGCTLMSGFGLDPDVRDALCGCLRDDGIY